MLIMQYNRLEPANCGRLVQATGTTVPNAQQTLVAGAVKPDVDTCQEFKVELKTMCAVKKADLHQLIS